MIRDLEKKGLTQAEIAEKCMASQPYISQLRNRQRQTPNYEIGERLMALHQSVCGGRVAARA